MIRKILISVLLLLVVVSVASASEEAEFKMINALNYHKGMFNALNANVLMRIPFGATAKSVGGSEQDPDVYTAGVPFAFRPASDGSVWILDSANKALKNFQADGSLAKNISLEKFGVVIRDFAFDGDTGFWLLNPVDGFITRIDLSGNPVSKIEGFSDARAIEVGINGELLVDMPVMGSVLRFNKDETLREEIPCDETLSLIEGTGGKLLGLEMLEKTANLTLRTLASPSQSVNLASFPLDIEDPSVKYAGAEILGRDASGNLYLSLIACNDDGAIYQDRLIRCTSMGKILAQTDILSVPYLSPDLPRHKVVTAAGGVMYFYTDANDYILAVYRF